MKVRIEVRPGMLLCALALLAAGASAATIKTAALQNEASPLVPFLYKKFEKPAVSDAPGERVAVFAHVGGKKCIFALDPDADPDTVVVCRRDLSPDGTRTFTKLGVVKLGSVSINGSSEVGWAARISSGRAGVFRSGPTFVADIGDAVPAPGSGLLQSFSFGRVNDAGDVAFVATISGGAVLAGVEVNQGIFRCSGGNGNCSAGQGGTGALTALVLRNDAVPDRPGRAFCQFFELAGSAFGIAFRAATRLDCADGGETPAFGIFRQAVGGPVVTLALEGEPSQPSPAPGGTIYSRLLGPPDLANSGMVAFQGTTTGLLANSILFLCDPAGCPSAPAADAVSQGMVDNDGNVMRTFSAPGVSDAGDLAFSAKVLSPFGTRDALYVRRPDATLETIALARVTPVPGASPPAVFRQLFPPSISAGGKVAFGARIERAARPRRLRGIFVLESPSGAFLDDREF